MVARGIHSNGGSSSWAAANIAGHNRARLIGERFNLLLVISEAGRTKHGSVLWNCLCDCGKTTQVTTNRLRIEHVKSCGCLSKKRIIELHKSRTKHGEGHGNKTKEYRAWTGMKDRCYYERHASYKYYGARGIEVCDRWKSDYSAFLEDMGRAEIGQSIDRIDVNGNYEPNNCRWADSKTQGRNKTNTSYFVFNGKKLKSIDVAEKFGIDRSKIYSYIEVRKHLEEHYG